MAGKITVIRETLINFNQANKFGSWPIKLKSLTPVSSFDLKFLTQIFAKHGRKFEHDLILCSARRCKYNFIQVLLCKSFDAHLKPFPTNFWLTCPYLIYRAAKLEAQGGVKQLENFLTAHNKFKDWDKYNRGHSLLRMSLINFRTRDFLRKHRPKIFNALKSNGIGGIKTRPNEIKIKCLHLQTASFLALDYHPAELWLKNNGLINDCNCENYCC